MDISLLIVFSLENVSHFLVHQKPTNFRLYSGHCNVTFWSLWILF